jgi:hypothetical protein
MAAAIDTRGVLAVHVIEGAPRNPGVHTKLPCECLDVRGRLLPRVGAARERDPV